MIFGGLVSRCSSRVKKPFYGAQDERIFNTLHSTRNILRGEVLEKIIFDEEDMSLEGERPAAPIVISCVSSKKKITLKNIEEEDSDVLKLKEEPKLEVVEQIKLMVLDPTDETKTVRFGTELEPGLEQEIIEVLRRKSPGRWEI
ncbi:hypothetical protein DH2020_000834 [Rehmannia glutinosa]|uniref:Uncharacterized protein n=1 Tax=Rehmannia glutinosa TaxID=99300 RepID=A0ABR0XYA7_REHGL